MCWLTAQSNGKEDNMSKQDRQGARTPADLEQKYKFGQTFAEILGIAEGAKRTAEKASSDLNKKLTHDEIFNLLTNNGTLQGIYRDKDTGEIYINAEYIKALEKIFTGDLLMNGQFSNTIEVFLEPGKEELEIINEHCGGIFTDNIKIPDEQIPLYDFDGDGEVTIFDYDLALSAYIGDSSLAEWERAKKSKITLTIDLQNPQKCIRIEGENMWGRKINKYIGINSTNIRYSQSQDWIEEIRWFEQWEIEMWASGRCVCHARFYDEVNFENNWHNVARYAERQYDFPHGYFIAPPDFVSVQPVVCKNDNTGEYGLVSISVKEYTDAILGFFVIDHINSSTTTTRYVSYCVTAAGRWKPYITII